MGSFCKIRTKVGSISPGSTEEVAPLMSSFHCHFLTRYKIKQELNKIMKKIPVILHHQTLDQTALSLKCILHIHLTPGVCNLLPLGRLLAHFPQPGLEVGCVQGFAVTSGPHSLAQKRLSSATEWLLWEQAFHPEQIWAQYFKTSCTSLTQLFAAAFLRA